jgi:hypothetical protein
MGKTGRNEARKATANYLNGIAIAVMAGAIVGPAIQGQFYTIARLVITLCISLALHGIARLVVRPSED